MTPLSSTFRKLLTASTVLTCLLGLSWPTVADIGDTLEVSADGARLRTLPSTKGTIIQGMKRGESLTELLRKDNWVRVRLKGQDKAGWVFHSSVKVVQTASKTSVRPDAAINTVPDETALTLSLGELGYKDGVLFEGIAANHARKLYFQVPQDITTRQGLLRIHYRFSSLLNSHSNMRVYVNGSPRRIVSLGGDVQSGWLNINLNHADLQQRFVQIEIRSAMLISKDRCFDERIGGAFLQILPDTTLLWRLQGKIASIRSYWQLLPKQVQVSLPQGELDATQFRNALGLTQQLLRSGHQVTYTRLPEIGDIVVAPREKIEDWMRSEYKDDSAENFSKTIDNKNLALVNAPDKQFLAVMGMHDKQSLRFLSDDWRGLAAGGEYQLFTGLQHAELADERYALKLQDMGMNTTVIEMSQKASWSTTIKPSHLPPGHRLDKLRIQLISAPSSNNKPVMFYTYLNGVLAKAVRLADSGNTQEIVLKLPRAQMERTNNLHFVAQRDLSGQDKNCTGEPSSFPIQIRPDSVVQTVVDDATPERFADMPVYLSMGYDTFLPQAYLQKADKLLPYLASIMADMDLPLQSGRLRFYQAQEKISPTAPFILLGQAQTAFDQQGVRFDKGRIDVVNQQGDALLAIDALPKISIAQVVRQAGVYGLWLMPPESGQLSPIDGMHLSKDDVAFADQQGVLLTLDSSQPGLSRIEYPDSTGWFELFGEYRFWYFALGWLLLTSLIVYLYRLSKAHRK
jgi:hypothetical protein